MICMTCALCYHPSLLMWGLMGLYPGPPPPLSAAPHALQFFVVESCLHAKSHVGRQAGGRGLRAVSGWMAGGSAGVWAHMLYSCICLLGTRWVGVEVGRSFLPHACSFLVRE